MTQPSPMQIVDEEEEGTGLINDTTLQSYRIPSQARKASVIKSKTKTKRASVE